MSEESGATIEANNSEPITVLLNWQAGLKR